MTSGTPTLRLGTRGSALARWQADRVAGLLARHGVGTEIVVIRTSGDEGGDRPAPGTVVKRTFTKEIEDALLDGRIDLAVHSLKDLAAVLPAGLALAAVPERADPRDVLVSRDGVDLDALPDGARVGTGSVRRRAALLLARPGLEVSPLRGNVPTRVRRMEQGDVDAVVLAAAGLARLALEAAHTALPPDVVMPAPGQGALAVQCREADAATRDLVAAIDDTTVRAAVTAERRVLALLEGGCQAPIGALCTREANGLVLDARVYAPDGGRVIGARVPVDAADAGAAGDAAAAELRAQGADGLIAAARSGGAAS